VAQSVLAIRLARPVDRSAQRLALIDGQSCPGRPGEEPGRIALLLSTDNFKVINEPVACGGRPVADRGASRLAQVARRSDTVPSARRVRGAPEHVTGSYDAYLLATRCCAASKSLSSTEARVPLTASIGVVVNTDPEANAGTPADADVPLPGQGEGPRPDRNVPPTLRDHANERHRLASECAGPWKKASSPRISAVLLPGRHSLIGPSTCRWQHLRTAWSSGKFISLAEEFGIINALVLGARRGLPSAGAVGLRRQPGAGRAHNARARMPGFIMAVNVSAPTREPLRGLVAPPCPPTTSTPQLCWRSPRRDDRGVRALP